MRRGGTLGLSVEWMDRGPVGQWSVTGALNASSGGGVLCLDGVTFSGSPGFHPGTGMGRGNLLGFPSHLCLPSQSYSGMPMAECLPLRQPAESRASL